MQYCFNNYKMLDLVKPTYLANKVTG